MKNKLNRKKGMTLIEIIISMMIITVMLIPILGMVVNAAKSNASGEAKQKATLAGQQIFENIKSDIALQELAINSNSSYIDINGIRLQKDGDKYKTNDSGSDYEFNGQKYKVQIEMKKNDSLQSTSSSSVDYDGQYEVSGQNGSSIVKLVKYGTKVIGTINDSSSISKNIINIEQTADKRSVKVNNSIIINSKNADKIKGKILLDFTKLKLDGLGSDKKILVNVKNLSKTDDIEICTQKIENQDIEIEVENDENSEGTIKTYYQDIEKSNIDGISEPWDININVFKSGSSVKLFSGDIMQNIKTN